MLNNTQKIFLQIQSKIDDAEKLKKPVDGLIKQQISLLENAHDDFVKATLEKNYKAKDSLDFAQAQIKQLQAIKLLCQKIGLSTEKYDKKINEIRKYHLGVSFDVSKR